MSLTPTRSMATLRRSLNDCTSGMTTPLTRALGAGRPDFALVGVALLAGMRWCGIAGGQHGAGCSRPEFGRTAGGYFIRLSKTDPAQPSPMGTPKKAPASQSKDRGAARPKNDPLYADLSTPADPPPAANAETGPIVESTAMAINAPTPVRPPVRRGANGEPASSTATPTPIPATDAAPIA